MDFIQKGNKFVITTPSAKLYPLPESYREAVTSGKALSYGIRDFVDISEIKPKTIRKSIQLPVVRYTNVTKSPNFDAYIVDYKDKLWVLQSSDVNINTLLVEQNAGKSLAISDRAYVMETGSIVLTGTGAELAQSDEVRKAYLGG